MEDNDDRKVCLDYLCIDLNYVEEQRRYSHLSHKETQLILQLLSLTLQQLILANESSVCSILLPLLKKLDGAEPISGPKTLKSILRSKSTFKNEALKDVIINYLSSAPAKGNKSSSASKVHSAPAGVKIKDDLPLAIIMKELHNLKLQFSKNQSSHSRNDQSHHTSKQIQNTIQKEL
nr:hypothetical protein [Tanacetum cinerariifolium]